MYPFIQKIEKIMINQLKSQKVFFRVSIESELPSKMFSDPEKLEQILLNLLLNAQKFTQQGWIKFKVLKVYPKKSNPFQDSPSHMKRENSQSHKTLSPNESYDNKGDYFVRFMAIDTGIGIEKERLQTIFNLFE